MKMMYIILLVALFIMAGCNKTPVVDEYDVNEISVDIVEPGPPEEIAVPIEPVPTEAEIIAARIEKDRESLNNIYRVFQEDKNILLLEGLIQLEDKYDLIKDEYDDIIQCMQDLAIEWTEEDFTILLESLEDETEEKLAESLAKLTEFFENDIFSNDNIDIEALQVAIAEEIEKFQTDLDGLIAERIAQEEAEAARRAAAKVENNSQTTNGGLRSKITPEMKAYFDSIGFDPDTAHIFDLLDNISAFNGMKWREEVAAAAEQGYTLTRGF